MQKIYAILTALFLLLPAAAMADTLATIEVGHVQDRDVYGGLGDNGGPLGAVTEFTQPQHSTPFLTIGGRHAGMFQTDYIYVVRKGQGMMICADAAGTDSGCVPCSECNGLQDRLASLDVAKTLGLYQQLLVQYTVSAVNRSGNRIELHKATDAAAGATEFVTGTMHQNSAPGVAERFGKTAYLFKALNQKDFHLCPERRYDAYACIICDDCAAKGYLFEPLR